MKFNNLSTMKPINVNLLISVGDCYLFTARYAALLLIVTFLWTAPASAADAVALARVGATDLKPDEVRAFYGTLDSREQAALASNPALLDQTMRVYLVQQLVLKEAQAKQWDKKASVQAQIEQARQNVVMESYLQSVCEPPADFPSDAALKKVYDANKDSFKVPKRYRVAQIFIALPKGSDVAATDKAHAEMDQVLKSLKEPGADFSAIANAHSDEKRTAATGGEIGWLAEAQIQAEIRGKVIALSKGAVSEPIRLADGWHVLKLLEIKEAALASFDEVKNALAQRVRTEQTKANRQAYVAKLLDQNPISLNTPALAKTLNLPTSPKN